MSRPGRLAASLLAPLLAPAFAQAPPAATTPSKPSFGVDVDVVAVDVGVFDRDGRPVAGLGMPDFTLSIDGHPRALQSVEFVSYGGAEAAVAAPFAPGALMTNEGVLPGRLVLIAVDTGSLKSSSSRAVMRTAAGFLDALGPNDRVGLVTFPAPGLNVEAGRDRAPVRQALERVVGKASPGSRRMTVTEAMAFAEHDDTRWDPVVTRECPPGMGPRDVEICTSLLESEAFQFTNDVRQQAAQAVSALRALFDALARVDGSKSLVLISGGMGVAEASDVNDLAARASRARVTLNVLRVEDRGVDGTQAARLDDSEDRMRSEGGLSGLATLARGTLFTVVGAGEKAFARMAQELSANYLLGFAPEAADRDGKDHEIKVGVARPGVSVRVHRRLNIPPAGPLRPARELLARALASPFELGELPLRAVAFRLPSLDGKQPRLLVSVQAGRPGDALGEVLVGAALIDAQGRPGADGAAAAQPPDATEPATGAVVLAAPAGAWTLRLAAVDGRGRRGRLDRRLDLRTTLLGRIELGDLIPAPADAPAAGGGLHPLIEVDLGRAPAAAYTELGAPLVAEIERTSLTFEIADDERGPALVSQPLVPRKLDARRAAVQAELPSDLLPPGDYVVRLVVRAAGQSAQVTRRIQVTLPATSAEAAARARGLRPSADFLSAAVAPFKREDALAPELLESALARLASLQGPPAGRLAEAAGQARAGDWPGVLKSLGRAGESGLGADFLRGLALYATGENAAAAAQLRLAARQSPDFFGTALYLGACLAVQGQDRQAVGAWQTALIGEGARTPALYRLLADALLRTGQADGARDVLEEALEEGPEPSLQRRLAVALALQGERVRALDLMAQVAGDARDGALLWAVLRLRFQAYLAGEGAAGALAHDARAYLAVASEHQALVQHWLRALEPAAGGS